MGPTKTDVIVIGEGITGLCIAYWLKKRGVEATVLAKDSEVMAFCTRQAQTPDWKRRRSLRNSSPT
jgi:glycine/D-amino acid oxidase-like deaminating enzyme